MIQSLINGNTKVFAVIGDPIGHTFSPVIHNTLASRLGHEITYVPLHVLGGRLSDAIVGAHALGIQGINVTIPHKKSVVEHTCGLDSTAIAVGTVNTLRYTDAGYIGYNTDITGLAKVVYMQGISLKNKSVAVLGAGGSAYAAVAMAAEQGAGKIFISNRTRVNAENLASHINTHYNNISTTVLTYPEMECETPDVIIQTSASGFGAYADETPVKGPRIFTNAELVIDIIYKPWETQFLKLARQQDCVCVNGLDMLVYQAFASYEIWQGIKLDDGFVKKLKEDLAGYYTA